MTRLNKIVGGVVKKYLGPARRAGKYIYKPTGENWETDLFPNSKFKDFKKCEYTVYVSRDLEQIIGNVLSMSWASKKIFGSHAANFENELRQKIVVNFGNKKFIERVNFWMYLLRK